MALNDKNVPTDLARLRAELSQPHVLAMWDGGSFSRLVADGESISVGRAAACDVVIDHPSVSRRHALITVGSPGRIEDLGSVNGTRIGHVVLRSGDSAVLECGQAVAIGDALLVIHGVSEATERARTAPPGAPVGPLPAGPRAPFPPPPPTLPAVPFAARGPLDEVTVVNDEVTRRIHEIVHLVAKSDLPVLLLGDTGVGKDVVAELIHRRSPRAPRPFVRVNCAAMPSALLESELFGYERGAFTGASQAKAGLVEAANGGTMFLDEIGEMDPAMQSKLLHVLERSEVMRVGSLRPRPVDVRFVAATNREIDKLVAQGAFRKDLYFRLKGMSILIPPLAARPREIAPLATLFLERACLKLGRATLSISPAALECLESYSWPGNIRELRNAMDRAAALCPGSAVEIEHLPVECTLEALPVSPGGDPDPAHAEETPPASKDMRDEVRDATRSLERERIIEALQRCAGNQSAAARTLGISRRTLVARLVAYQIPRPIKQNER
jgi:two-component system, NtrC family, response regulator AtoC